MNNEITDKQLIAMVTTNPIHAFKLEETGKIEAGKIADMVVFNRSDNNPYTSIVNAELADVKLVVIEGMPVYGDAEYAELFEKLEVPVQNIVLDKTEKLVIGDVIGLLRRINRAVGFYKKLPFLPVSLN
jgi:5-methylthioadenosine/S-adenosylhomocysteine deaminase